MEMSRIDRFCHITESFPMVCDSILELFSVHHQIWNECQLNESMSRAQEQLLAYHQVQSLGFSTSVLGSHY